MIDYHIVQDNLINGAAKMIATANIRRQVIYMFAQLCAVLLGINAMTIPANPIAPRDTPVVAAVIVIGWEVLLIINALYDHFDRNKLLAYIGGRRKDDRSGDSTIPS